MATNLDQFTYFCRVAESGSFTRAARTLRVSQPALSKAIRQLESHYGVRLLSRGPKGVALTSEGKALYEGSHEILEAFAGLEHRLRSLEGECRGELSLGTSDNFANYLLPGLLDSFLGRHPQVSVKLFSGTSESILTEILERRSELGLFFNRKETPGIRYQLLTEVEFVIVCSSLSPLAAKPAQALKALPKLTYIGSRSSDYRAPYAALKMLGSLGLRPTRVIESNNQETQKRLSLQGLGYTLVPRFMVRSEIHSGTAFVVPLPRKLQAPLFWALPAKASLSKPAEVFRTFIGQAIPGGI